MGKVGARGRREGKTAKRRKLANMRVRVCASPSSFCNSVLFLTMLIMLSFVFSPRLFSGLRCIYIYPRRVLVEQILLVSWENRGSLFRVYHSTNIHWARC